MSTESDNFLDFFISSRDGLTIVTLVGSLSMDHSETIKHCLNEVDISEDTHGVLYVRDLYNLEESGLPVLKQLIDCMTNRFGTHFTLCSVKPTVRLTLVQKGVCEESVFSNNLKEVILLRAQNKF